ncbi:hypothetical protein [Olivibacter jilunii]|uniref:hypothetical protein n=1 Tax=Olivibacter jilunii TaxID=985016 RepID=UPI00102FE058|nr:hypothetical protein [Olivibacter jilunii]
MNHQKITDLYGRPIEVTDLNKAIEQAREFTGYRHPDKSFELFDRQQHLYWQDMLDKLLALKNEL